jgi:Cu2+-containing amine oxidase
MWRGSAPFAIVPYHHPNTNGEPPGPHFSYKDGVDTQCGGAPFRALQHGAPNSGAPWQSAAFDAADDTDAVVVTVTPADDFNPARLTITAKFQCGWYQYVHSWEFDSYGSIHPRVAMGGMLNPNCPTKAHFHNFYFRIDLDIDGQFPHDVCEIFNHNSLNDPPGDKWDPVPNQTKLLANPDTARKWRVRNTVRKNRAGAFNSLVYG